MHQKAGIMNGDWGKELEYLFGDPVSGSIRVSDSW